MNYDHSLGRRFVAFIIDMLILGAISTFLISLGLGVEVEIFMGITQTTLPYWQETLLYLIYFLGFAIFNQGMTIGKLLLKLQIKTIEYGDLSLNKLIIREVVKVLLMPISFISFIIALLKSDRKSLHDMIMNTYVVREIEEINDPYNVRPDIKSNKEKRNDDVLSDDYYDDPADKDTFNS